MTCYSIELRTKIYVNTYKFLAFVNILPNKFDKQLLHNASCAAKSGSKKVFHKTAEASLCLKRHQEMLNK